jgi:peptidoglycan hydrolase CwlO-like protein
MTRTAVSINHLGLGSAEMSVPEIETARELATHASDIKHLQDDMDAMKTDVAAIRKSIEEINKTLSEARGGWKVLIWAGGAASGLSALAGFISGKWSA